MSSNVMVHQKFPPYELVETTKSSQVMIISERLDILLARLIVNVAFLALESVKFAKSAVPICFQAIFEKLVSALDLLLFTVEFR